MLNYKKLFDNTPTILAVMTNSLGQTIDLVESPLKGEDVPVIAMCHDLQLAGYTDFYDLGDMLAEHKEYEPLFIDGKLQHGNY